MKREILCEKCGVLKPLPAADVANGVERRRLIGRSDRYFCCDGCSAELAPGTRIIAETTWYKNRESNPEDWEEEYGSFDH